MTSKSPFISEVFLALFLRYPWLEVLPYSSGCPLSSRTSLLLGTLLFSRSRFPSQESCWDPDSILKTLVVPPRGPIILEVDVNPVPYSFFPKYFRAPLEPRLPNRTWETFPLDGFGTQALAFQDVVGIMAYHPKQWATFCLLEPFVASPKVDKDSHPRAESEFQAIEAGWRL